MARKKKTSPNPGLTPPSLLEQIRNETADQDVQKVLAKRPSGKSVLQPAHKASTGATGLGGIFGTAGVPDGKRDSKTDEKSIPDAKSGQLDIALSDLVRNIMLEPTAEGLTHMEGMVRQVAMRAAKGEQWAVAWVGDRIEGKPGQMAKRTASIEDVETTIDSAEVAALNKLLKENDG